jgi:23S rRNA (uridine2552-2'-O)-methyltransferase
MDALADVEFVQGDFTEETVFEQILQLLDGMPVDLVISDMAPNMSGMKEVDQPRMMYLAELAVDLARKVLKPGGHFLTKIFQGEGFDTFHRELRQDFGKVITRKPEASRPRSREVYLLARDYRGGAN